MEGEDRDGYRDQIVTCDVGVSLHSKTRPLFIKYKIMAQAHSFMHTSIRACFLYFSYNPYMSLLIIWSSSYIHTFSLIMSLILL